MVKNVESMTVKNNLCTSCGICKSVCPKDCIEFARIGGQYVPHIKAGECVECGICLDICPGFKVDFHKLYAQSKQQVAENLYVGNYKACFTAAAKDNDIRNKGVSGGCITAIVKELLSTCRYDVAFLVNSYEYNQFLETEPYREKDSLTATEKSRYVPISHSNMIKYVLDNRDDKVIIVATSCAIQGFLNVVSKFNLNRDNYLILGLFCDKTMSYNVFEYFSDYGNPKSHLKNLLFRTKESGGWPGQVKLEYENGDVQFLQAEERMLLKDYFQLERCMYCIDKLNQFADISLGDNYTEKNGSIEGSNSVIVRTIKGWNIWKMLSPIIEMSPITINDISISQHINERLKNYEFARINEKKVGINLYPNSNLGSISISSITCKMLERKLDLICVGRKYEEERISFHRRIKHLKIRNFTGRAKNYIIRKFRGYNNK